jgi:DNA replication protein DnaC
LLRTLKDRLPFRDKSYTLRIPREEECESILLLGDPGTGKSQTIHQFMNQVARREPAEAGVCFDPRASSWKRTSTLRQTLSSTLWTRAFFTGRPRAKS